MSSKQHRGNCYAASEALYHILGGRDSGWVPCVMRYRSDTHWFLCHRDSGEVLDPSRLQFRGRLPDYTRARRCGFLTRYPSRRARALMRAMTWQSAARRLQK